MNRKHTLTFLGLSTLALVSFLKFAQANSPPPGGVGGPLYNLSVQPPALNVDTPTAMLISLPIQRSDEKVTKVSLEQLDSKDQIKKLSEFQDNGLDGDSLAGL